MSEQAPSEEVDTPTIASPEAGTPGSQQTPEQVQAEIDYQQRYDELRPEFDRKSQRLSELEQREQWFDLLATSEDPETRRQAAQNLGYDVTDDDEPADPNEALAREVAAIKEQLANQSQEAQQAAQIAQIESYVERELSGLEGLDERDRKMIVNAAVSMPPTPDGMPDIQAAHKEFQEWEQDRMKKWRETKRTTHRVSAVGGEGTQQPDLSTREGRDAYVLSQLEDD